MATFYLQIRWIHIACIMASGSLFCLRGLLMLARSPHANHVALRWLSYVIDTTLLTAALMLTQIVRQYPFTHAWLTMKIVLLVIYIVLGALALKYGRTHRIKVICFIAALTVYLSIYSIARTHHPLGWLNYLL